MCQLLRKITGLVQFIAIRNFSNKSRSVLEVLKKHSIGEELILKGWIKSLRKHKDNVFINLGDGSSEKIIQIVLPQNLSPKNISTGSSISASGIVSLSPKGDIELHAHNVETYGECVTADGYPFAPRKQYLPEYIRQYLHFRPRTNEFASLLRVRNSATLAIHKYLNSEGYVNIHTPVLTSNDCEGAGEVFKVLPDNLKLLKSMSKEGTSSDEAFFDTVAFLSVSGQLQLEAAAHGLSKAYTFGPTFRAENSRTRFHLSEFYMLEAEIAFLENLEDLILIIEYLVKNITKMVIDASENDMKVCRVENKSSLTWLDKKFPILTYKDAVNILKENKTKFTEFEGKNGSKEQMSKEQEIFLVQHCGGIPTFIINWPKHTKPFYTKDCNVDSNEVFALDLLAPEVGEIVGGSLRENDYQKLKDKLPKGNSKLDWYLDLRKFGGVPTGGYGMGFDRYLMFLLGINSIKDVIPFPRWPHHCDL